MVAIQYEVGVSDSVQLDRRYTGRAFDRTLHSGPAKLIAVIAREELAVKIGVAADTADDRVERHIFKPATAADAASELMFDLIEREQPARPTDQVANDSIKICLLPRAPKIVDRGQAGGSSIEHVETFFCHSEGAFLTRWRGEAEAQRHETRDKEH